MDNEENRLRTFREWSREGSVEARVAARAGFYRTGQGREIQCWRCGGRITDWDGDIEMLHRRLDPTCPLIIEESPVRVTCESNNTIYPDDTDDSIYKIDVLRLISFALWPIDYISRESLAAAGFYYIGGGDDSRDKVRCAWCGGELMNWTRGDDPLAEHLKHFPQCDYAKAKHRDITSNGSSRSAQSINEVVLEQRVEGVLVGGVAGSMAESSMANREVRERTFDNRWPTHLHQRPRDLAAAGFYYVGPEDQVKCFQCGGGLKAWVSNDNPWMEHAKWFPACSYLALAGDRHHWVEACMEQAPALQALACGLQPHVLRKAISKRLAIAGAPFPDTESLIDAALNEQLNEESFSTPDVSTLSGGESLPVIFTNHRGLEEDTHQETAEMGRESRATTRPTAHQDNCGGSGRDNGEEIGVVQQEKTTSRDGDSDIHEENRRLKEARLCKVCMDSEVGIVFLPCGHLVSCVQCAPCLSACPLCRATVKGIVRTYLS